MTSREKIQLQYPSAYVKHIPKGDSEEFGIFMAGATKPVAIGNTPNKAWLNAKNKMENGGL